MKRTRILILYASVGTGHKAAALALAKAFALRGADHVRCEDALDHASGIFRQIYAGSYLELSEKMPAVWRYLYERTDKDEPELSRHLRALIDRIGVTELTGIVRQYRPQAVICTHFLPLSLLAREKRTGRSSTPLYCVVTDYIGHVFWIEPQVDRYFVATAETGQMLVQRGALAERIEVTGIPVDPAIAHPKDPVTMRQIHDLKPSPVVILMGGGLPVEYAERIIHGLARRGFRGTLVVAAGRNSQLEARLRQGEIAGLALSLRGYGFVEHLDDLIAASDLVITKAGGLIVSEVMARGTPMILVNSTPGQEEWNADYAVSMGAGIQLYHLDMLPLAVETLLANPARLAVQRAAAASAGRPGAALRVADAVLALRD